MTLNPSDPDRALVKKKWAVNSVDGPLVLLAELVKKKLLHHRLPIDYVIDLNGDVAIFVPVKGRSFSPAMDRYFRTALAHVCADRKVGAYISGGSYMANAYQIELDGPHYVDDRGQLKRAKLSDLAKASGPSGR